MVWTRRVGAAVAVLWVVTLSCGARVAPVDARLTYPYAAGTPGTEGGPPATGLPTLPLAGNRRLEDRGLDGRAVGAGGPRQYQCDQLLEALSTHFNGLGAGAVTDYLNAAPVIGVAIVDHGGNGNTYAYFSKSNAPGGVDVAAGAAALKNEIVAVINAWNPHGGPVDARYTTGAAHLAHVDRWSMIQRQIPDAVNDAIIASTTPNVVLNSLPLWTGGEPATAWATTNQPNPLAPETIQFAPLRDGGGVVQTYVKRWWRNGAWQSDRSSNRHGACALQKLVSSLRGFGAAPLELFPGTNLARPFVGVGGTSFVCVAEVAFAGTINSLTNWIGNRPNYAPNSEVPSCTFCQAVVPKMLDGSYAPNFANCQMSNVVGTGVNQRPPHSTDRGTCAAPAHGARCSVNCHADYYPVPSFTVCHWSRFAPRQVCTPRRCRLAALPAHAGGLGNCADVAHNAQCSVPCLHGPPATRDCQFGAFVHVQQCAQPPALLAIKKLIKSKRDGRMEPN